MNKLCQGFLYIEFGSGRRETVSNKVNNLLVLLEGVLNANSYCINYVILFLKR